MTFLNDVGQEIEFEKKKPHLNRTCFYERTVEEKAYHKVKSIYVKRRDLASITKIKTRNDYAFSVPDQEIRYGI